jgi:ABC-type polysaccharide/polyol phosphate transport system ATPase subunit
MAPVTARQNAQKKTAPEAQASAAERPVQRRAMSQSEGSREITLDNVGVKYRLLTDDQRTLKGRVLGMFSGGSMQAEFWALRNLSLQVRSGDVLGVVGSNGSGKSTLIRVMSRIIEPVEGRVDIRGSISPMLELGGAFNPELTGRENAYLQGTLYGLSHDEVTRLLPEIQSFADIGPFFDVPVKTYSTGMVSRLGFSVAVQTKPDILLVDEVFSVGDENFQRKSALRMKKLIGEGVIVVLVTHNVALIRQMCNRTVWLDRGTLVEDGAPNDVVESYLRHITR